MIAFAENLQHFARYFKPPLGRLIRIGVDAERNGLRLVIGMREFLFKNRGGVFFGEDFSFKVQSRRKPKVGVRRPREAVYASVLASAIGICRMAMRNVGRIVFADDAAGGVPSNFGCGGGDIFAGEGIPAVVAGIADGFFKSSGGHADRPSPFVNRRYFHP